MAIVNPLNIAVDVSEPTTGMAQAVFNELVDKLQELAENAKQHVIDISSLPLSDSDKQQLETLLGQGEVQVTLSTIGESRIVETAYSGIWWVKHYTADDKLISELIEITRIPEIIKSHPDDIQHAANAIKKIIVNSEQEMRYEQ